MKKLYWHVNLWVSIICNLTIRRHTQWKMAMSRSQLWWRGIPLFGFFDNLHRAQMWILGSRTYSSHYLSCRGAWSNESLSTALSSHWRLESIAPTRRHKVCDWTNYSSPANCSAIGRKPICLTIFDVSTCKLFVFLENFIYTVFISKVVFIFFRCTQTFRTEGICYS